jgi:hypothetical protein
LPLRRRRIGPSCRIISAYFSASLPEEQSAENGPAHPGARQRPL